MQRQLEENSMMLDLRVAERTDRLERAHFDMLERLARTAECHDDDTSEHAQRVGRTAAMIATEMRLDERAVDLIRRAAPLHDIGKIAIPDAILHKPGPLTQEEYGLVKTHVTIGARLLGGGSTPALRIAAQIAMCHHERWDGRGYPFGMSGGDIPRTARIVALADVFDVLTHERPYKDAWPVAEALAEIERERGAHFDPDVVDAFKRLDHPALRFPTGESMIASLAHS
jgi:putative two-component system response regulator